MTVECPVCGGAVWKVYGTTDLDVTIDTADVDSTEAVFTWPPVSADVACANCGTEADGIARPSLDELLCELAPAAIAGRE